MTDPEMAKLVVEFDTKIAPTIPAPVKTRLQGLITEFPVLAERYPGGEIDRLKSTYASKFLLPAVQAQSSDPNDAQSKWVIALRATVAELRNLAASTNFDFLFQPVTVGGNPMQARDDPKNPSKSRDWRFRMFGLARCTDPKSPFEGPAGVMVYNFPTEAAAKVESERFVPGKLYLMRARLSDKSPKGTMKAGEIGIVNGTAAEATKEVTQPNGGAWADPFARLSEVIPASPIAEPLRNPKEYAVYRIEGEVMSGRMGATPSGQYGSLTITDDSVTGAIAEANGGGIALFLSKTDVPLARLSHGSRVAAIISGYKTKKKNAQGDRTGDEVWNWNANAVKVILDLGAGTQMPDPSKPAVSVPPSAPGVSRELFG